jgi:hypothetical protein
MTMDAKTLLKRLMELDQTVEFYEDLTAYLDAQAAADPQAAEERAVGKHFVERRGQHVENCKCFCCVEVEEVRARLGAQELVIPDPLTMTAGRYAAAVDALPAPVRPCHIWAQPAPREIYTWHCIGDGVDVWLPCGECPICRARLELDGTDQATPVAEAPAPEQETNWKQRALQAEDSYRMSVDILADALYGPETSPEYDMDVPHPAWANKAALAIRRLRGEAPATEDEQPAQEVSFDEQLAAMDAKIVRRHRTYYVVVAENKRERQGCECAACRVNEERESLAFAAENRLAPTVPDELVLESGDSAALLQVRQDVEAALDERFGAEKAALNSPPTVAPPFHVEACGCCGWAVEHCRCSTDEAPVLGPRVAEKLRQAGATWEISGNGGLLYVTPYGADESEEFYTGPNGLWAAVELCKSYDTRLPLTEWAAANGGERNAVLAECEKRGWEVHIAPRGRKLWRVCPVGGQWEAEDTASDALEAACSANMVPTPWGPEKPAAPKVTLEQIIARLDEWRREREREAPDGD